MSIVIQTKAQKTASTLVDCFRILAWQHYKSTNKGLKIEGKEVKGLELYEIFKANWVKHEIHKMDVAKIQKFIEEMGYSEEELLQIRADYRKQQANYQSKRESTESTESTESKVSQLKSKYQESDSEYEPKPF
ncbi:hypothetical protein [Planktothrix paucivesiculata]|uniref:Uncharacterized protein n=1 Tax=Planktothrix paucivesiculata PCC 9631 TaxID=671071 RepID=A0A7Z9BX43_9CYAN|nr:hypothetical protein [Planktothrix paucivesiculata]VXD24357.1 conserved hypothetical protein [Planktothrix paucivesiculata PCC 9631]